MTWRNFLDPQFEPLRKQWYANKSVMIQLIKSMMHREAVFMRYSDIRKEVVWHRNLKINHDVYFWKNAERFHFLTEPQNLYASLSLMPNVPMFSLNINEKKTQQKEFTKDYLNYLTTFDYLFDMDADPNKGYTIKDAYFETKKLKQILDEKNISYILTWSGNKGFHLRIPYESFPDWMKQMEIVSLVEMFKEFTVNFKAVKNFNLIDDSIMDTRRIFKLPYSVVYPNYLICIPLSDTQFNEFEYPLSVVLPTWLNRINEVFNRGLLQREGNPDAFGDLVKQYTDQGKKDNI